MQVRKEGVLIKKTAHSFESSGVLNPGVIKVGDTIHVFYRAVASGNFSSIGYCQLRSPLEVGSRSEIPYIYPEFDYESRGMEDPRIVKIENTYYLTYTAYNGLNALGALATSTDLIHWEKQGIVVPQITYKEFEFLTGPGPTMNDKYMRYNDFNKGPIHNEQHYVWDKNLVFFPRKIDNMFCMLHRIKPDIQILVRVADLKELTVEFWREYFHDFQAHVLLMPKYPHEVSYIGGGCPPIETAEGWLLIYHGVHDTIEGYVYSACAALLDIADPQKELARLPYPLFYPEMEWERNGEVNNVCFPTGAVEDKGRLYIYYGAADERIAVASMDMNELLAELLANKV